MVQPEVTPPEVELPEATLPDFAPAEVMPAEPVARQSEVTLPTPVTALPEPEVEDSTPATSTRTRRTVERTPRKTRHPLLVAIGLIWLAAVVLASGRLAESHDLWSQPDVVTRTGAVVATWLGITVLARRCGGRYILIGLFAAIVLGLVAAYPENWALAGAGVTAAAVHGVLGMTLTRPSAGLKALRELLISAFIGMGGAFVVSGYDVVLRPFRFRVMVLTLVLISGFALAWRLGHGIKSLGRRGVVLIAGGVLLLVLSVVYTQAIRAWGSPSLLASVSDFRDGLEKYLGAVPRPIEAVVGFPALVWGVTIRNRRRQGWWMCAFGSLGAAGVATSLIQPLTPLGDSLAATGYGIVIGGALGMILVAVDRVLTGPGGRRVESTSPGDVERPEPPRFAPLL